jgi:isocitrate/isopropylmalate dehydrogenase
MTDLIACLPGDGIGPEVLDQAVRVLESLPVDVQIVRLPFGGAAIDELGDPLPAETLAACRGARAVLLGAVGGPRWDGGAVRPEQGLIGLRKALDVYANLRPARQGAIDLLIVRELVGGLYYGARGVRDDGTVFDTCASPGGRLRLRRAVVARSCRSTRQTCSTRRGSGAGWSATSPSSSRTSSSGTRSWTVSRWRSSLRRSASTL